MIWFLSGQGVSVVVFFLQKYGGLKLFLAHRPYNGLSSDASAFGFLCSVALLLSIYLINDRSGKVRGFFFLSLFLLAILNSQNKTSLIPLVFLFLYILFKIPGKKKILLIVFCFFLILGLLNIPRISKIKTPLRLVKDFQTLVSGLKKTFTGKDKKGILENIDPYRHLLWGYSRDIIKKHPLTGVGPGNFIFWVMYDQYGQKYHHDWPGNQYLSISSSLGLIGILFFFIFIWDIIKRKNKIELYMLICVLLMIFFSSYLWVSESFLAFWIIIALGDNQNRIKKLKCRSKHKYGAIALIFIFILFNIFNFKNLHPITWAKETNTRYDYGFWYPEKSSEGHPYRWTKAKSGIYLYLDEKGESNEFKIVCGAPLVHLKDKKQEVKIYWRGKLYGQFTFKENDEFMFKIIDKNSQDGFLEIRVNPVFNLKKLNLSPESRDLGIRLYQDI